MILGGSFIRQYFVCQLFTNHNIILDTYFECFFILFSSNQELDSLVVLFVVDELVGHLLVIGVGIGRVIEDGVSGESVLVVGLHFGGDPFHIVEQFVLYS